MLNEARLMNLCQRESQLQINSLAKPLLRLTDGQMFPAQRNAVSSSSWCL